MIGAVKLMRVYERKSRAGKPYFVGFLGQSRVLIMRDDRAEVNGDTVAVWDVFIKERDEQSDQRTRPQAAGRDAEPSQPARPVYQRTTPRRARATARPAPSSTTTTSTTATNKGAREINQRLAHVNLKR
jgi:hypothetical protein